ncbi:MAG: ParB/RepB/Spo0J family partition protein [Paludibacteraceae bacterium]|nr:ParB/RepB/Spo0J family partition protein [Paludibacteraceae bacterium]MDI9536416.1 ParB/RepB/Spo0J family partition protein [Bacteroidota bacterium]MBP9038818.1 ParB/RepB/Spo0J family partition protein [Paludibacteraceae bacterium]HPB84279.1 ParB/RepB/Spo0J family partition protein [Paludibacteraceae bacterium]HQO47523.1 ParB/RepB/Spo0J family partition protein [Paludibacteraceae bacterium]
MKKQALGRGLSALLIDTEVTTSGSSSINEIAIEAIYANPNQPRTHFDAEALEELATSIREIGIISPITLREIDKNNYEIIAGERRYRAAKMIGLKKIPAYIKTAADDQVMEMALIENIQREDLNAIEIALTYNKLMTDYQLTQELLSERVGKKRATIANYLRLLKLPAEIQVGLKDKKIDMGHARALAGLDDPTVQIKLYEEVIKGDYSVRKTEEMVHAYMKKSPKNKRQKSELTASQREAKERISQQLALKVDLAYSNSGTGKLTVHLKSDADLQRIVALFDTKK